MFDNVYMSRIQSKTCSHSSSYP